MIADGESGRGLISDKQSSPRLEEIYHIEEDGISIITKDVHESVMNPHLQNGYIHIINNQSQTMDYVMPSENHSTNPLQMETIFAPSTQMANSYTSNSPCNSDQQFSPTSYISSRSDNMNSNSVYSTSDQESSPSPNSDKSIISPNHLPVLEDIDIEEIQWTNNWLASGDGFPNLSQYQTDAIPIPPRKTDRLMGMFYKTERADQEIMYILLKFL